MQLQIQHYLKLFLHFIFLIEFVLLYSLGFRLSNKEVNGKRNKMNHEFAKRRLHLINLISSSEKITELLDKEMKWI